MDVSHNMELCSIKDFRYVGEITNLRAYNYYIETLKAQSIHACLIFNIQGSK